MAVYCHGNGNESTGGCCWVNGALCPLLLRTDGASVYDNEDNNLGLIATWAASEFGVVDGVTAAAHFTGVTRLCSAGLRAAIAEPSDRAAFETTWANDTAYQAIADQWEAIGMPRNYCPIYGPNENQCCFAEDQATNDAATALLDGVAVTIRSLGAG